ncbi:MAG TPA: glycoside hydrolase family 3 N-terminal domain-containing protein [Gemmatimonadaceae bacterium]|nr:glycoside hydrolase family 3 N-terminal domain-containing protein [Gemmatimonadaceae bacterium]
MRPSAPLSAAERRWVDSTLASLSLRERVGQMVMVWVLGDFTNDDSPSFQEVRRWITEDKVGGILMSLGSPIEVAAKLNAMQALATVPLIVGSDVEPGLGRLEGGVFTPGLMQGGSATVLPTNMAIGATGDERLAYEAGRITGIESRAIGIHVAFAPTVDVNNNPANPVINTRSFGEDPEQVSRFSAAFVRGVQEEGVVATVKHFPGHGDTDVDSHNALPVVRSDRERLKHVELVPFRGAIDAGASAVMTAHIALPAIQGDSTPATLAPAIITGLLRDSLHFQGMTFTDALSMEGVGEGYSIEKSAVLAVLAGADVLTKPIDTRRAIDAVVQAVERGEIPPARIDASVRRILEWKVKTGAVARPIVPLDSLRAVVGAPAHWAMADTIARRAVTLIRDRGPLLPLRAGPRVTVVSYTAETDPVGGRTFAAEVRRVIPGARLVRVSPQTGRATLDSLAATLGANDRLVITTHVRTIEGEGRFAIAPQVASWVDATARRVPTVVVAHGNPYVIRQFPSVGAYLVTYGQGQALEQASARAVLGEASISGKAPIALPGVFQRGDGIARPAAR